MPPAVVSLHADELAVEQAPLARDVPTSYHEPEAREAIAVGPDDERGADREAALLRPVDDHRPGRVAMPQRPCGAKACIISYAFRLHPLPRPAGPRHRGPGIQIPQMGKILANW